MKQLIILISTFGFMVLHPGADYAVAQEEINVSTKEVETPLSKKWGVGLSWAGDMSLGVKTEYRMDSDWVASLNISTKGNNCCMGGNPIGGIPYGHKVEAFRKISSSITFTKNFALGESGTWTTVVGVGIGLTDTISRAQFYDQTFIGYDLNSPAGSDSVRQRRIVLPAQIGLRRHNVSLFDRPVVLSVLMEVPINGRGDSPSFVAPNGRAVSPSSFWFEDGAIKVEAILFL